MFITLSILTDIIESTWLGENPKMEVLICIAIFVAIIGVFVTSASCYLQHYGLKISKEEDESEKEELNRREKMMYGFNISLLILTTIVIGAIKNVLALIPLFFIGISIIARVNKKKKFSNILCWVIIIPILTIPLIIGVSAGILVSNEKCSDTIEWGTYKVQAFNSKFEQYAGEKVRGSNVKTLVAQVVSSNANPENINLRIEVSTGTGEMIVDINKDYNSDLNPNYSLIKPDSLYKVEMKYSQEGPNMGCVNAIVITQQ